VNLTFFLLRLLFEPFVTELIHRAIDHRRDAAKKDVRFSAAVKPRPVENAIRPGPGDSWWHAQGLAPPAGRLMMGMIEVAAGAEVIL
jgi:hypothetical protein